MSPNKSSAPFRFSLAAVVVCGSLLLPGEAHAQGPRPTITRIANQLNESFSITIDFGAIVSHFERSDVRLTNATGINWNGFGVDNQRFTFDLLPREGLDGTVTITIPAAAARNAAGSTQRETLSFQVDNRDPRATSAVVNRTTLTIDFSEPLAKENVPVRDLFRVDVIDVDNDVVRATIDGVDVEGDEVILTLARTVRHDDFVELWYDNDHGSAVTDTIGNIAPSFGPEIPVRNTTIAGAGSPGPPTALTAKVISASVIELDWVAPVNHGDTTLTGYRIEVSADGGRTWSDLVADTKDTLTAYRHTGLATGVTRHYRVSAINALGAGLPSNVVSAATQGQVPNPPTGLTATARGTSSIRLDWRAGLSGTAGPISGYLIEVASSRSGPWTVLVADTRSRTTFYNHTGIDAGTTNYYRISAINSAGVGGPSGIASATTQGSAPGAPRNLRVQASGFGQNIGLRLTWTSPASDGGSRVTGYRIQVSSTGTSGWTDVERNTRSAATNYTHSPLPPGTTRYYRIAAINALGTGPYSSVASGMTRAARPGAPIAVNARASGPRSITVSWRPPTDDGGASVTSYRIFRRGPRDTNFILQGTTQAPATSFRDTRALLPATTYSYQVSAVNSAGEGDRSLTASTTTTADVPGAPTSLTASPRGTSTIDLRWIPPTNDRGARVIGYRIEQSNDGRRWRILRSNTGTTSTRFSHENLQPATTRYYRVSAINSQGIGAPSNVARATTEATVPGAPRNLSAEADGTSEIDLAWQAPTTDGGAEIEGYRIEVAENSGGPWARLVANTRNTSTTYTHTGLAPATTRHYRISAINRIGAGQPSRVASATTDATVPDPPTGLTATATSPTQIDLSWTAPAYNGGAEISGYRIEVAETGQHWVNLVANSGVAATTYSHTGLLPGSRRYYRVSAINVAGTGMPSGVASAATDDPVQRAARLNTKVLPHVAAAMTSSTVAAIADRVDAVANGQGFERRMDVGGLSSMAASFGSQGMAGTGPGRNGRPGLSSLLGGASFQLPFGAANAPQQVGSGSQLATWGAGEYQHMGEPDETTLDWSGNMVSAHVGADTRVAPDILAGVAASYATGAFDFTDRTGATPVDGTYGTAMASVNPYVAWFPGVPGSAAWASVGFGWGDLEVEDDREALRTSPARMMSGAAGGSYKLIESGFGGIRVKAEGWAGRVMVDGSARIDSVTLGMQRAKLALEWTQGYRSANGDEIAVVLEGGMRYDNGDGVNGAGAELGGGLRYNNARLGLRAEGRGRLLVSGRAGYEEWGFGGMIQFDPAERNEGLSIRLAPSYGDAASGVNELWDSGVSDAVHGRELVGGANVDAEVAYGLAGFHGTPYTGFRLTESGARAFSSGLRYNVGSGIGVRLEGTRRESALGGAEHTVGIRGRLRLR